MGMIARITRLRKLSPQSDKHRIYVKLNPKISQYNNCILPHSLLGQWSPNEGGATHLSFFCSPFHFRRCLWSLSFTSCSTLRRLQNMKIDVRVAKQKNNNM